MTSYAAVNMANHVINTQHDLFMTQWAETQVNHIITSSKGGVSARWNGNKKNKKKWKGLAKFSIAPTEYIPNGIALPS